LIQRCTSKFILRDPIAVVNEGQLSLFFGWSCSVQLVHADQPDNQTQAVQPLSFNKKKIPLVSSVERDLSANYRRKVFDLLKETYCTARANIQKNLQRKRNCGLLLGLSLSFSNVEMF